MSRPVIITCAITGSRPSKRDNPAVPITPQEQIESTHAAFEAGASVVHIHVRDDAGKPTYAVERYGEVMEGVRKHCPGMVVQLSTGGVGLADDRRAMLDLKPDMASLATGSVNFPTHVYQNPPALIEDLARAMRDLGIKPEIEVFDLSMLYNAKALADSGLIAGSAHVLFVLGLGAALPAKRPMAEFLISELHEICPRATFTISGIGRFQEPVMDWSLYNGGHLRTGLEDNVRLSRDTLAESNAQLVARAVALCASYGVHPASPSEAREVLGLAAMDGAAA